MDDPGASKNLGSRHRFVLCAAAALLLLTALASCLTSPPRPLFRPEPAVFAALTEAIAKFRALPLKRNIALSPSIEEIPAQSEATAPFELKHVEQAYKSIGLIPMDTDLGAALGEYRRLEQLFNYDSANGTIALAPAAAKLGTPFEKTDPVLARDAPLDFAIVAALQEQNFAWQERTRSVFLEDHRLALRAVAIGDGAITTIARAANNIDLSARELARSARFADELEQAAGRLPAFLRSKITFPYRDGSRFVLWALKARSWPGVNALYTNPPASTAALLHPEKYFISAEPPLRFFPAALLNQPGENLAVEQSLGEFLVRALLAGDIDVKSAGEIAAAWRGDQLFTFQQSAELETIWYSAWTSPRQAAQFQRAYKSLLERRLRFRFDDPSAPSIESPLSGRTRDNRGVWLQARDSVVLLLSGIPMERLRQRADAAWRDLEIDTDPAGLRFDSVRWQRVRNERSRFVGVVK